MRYLLLFAVLVLGSAGAAEVYRWVDKDGVVHYSDQWQPGAETIRLQNSPTYRGRNSAADGAPPEAPPDPESANTGYRELTILSPAQEEVLWNTGGKLRVSLQVTPSLQAGDRLRLFLDGTERELPAGSTGVNLEDVYRGVHTLIAEVVNQQGAVQVKSAPTTFVVRQTSVAQPGAATPRPRP
jgi:Domain of unknown function (DUF4124)